MPLHFRQRAPWAVQILFSAMAEIPKRDRSPEPGPRQKKIYLVHYCSVHRDTTEFGIPKAFDTQGAAIAYCIEQSKKWPGAVRTELLWTGESTSLGGKKTLHYLNVKPILLEMQLGWSAHLAVGKRVTVEAYPDDFEAIVSNNSIEVGGLRFLADQVYFASNGWQVGSVLLLNDGREVTIDKCPKIRVDWFKLKNDNDLRRTPYHKKVYLTNIKTE